MAGGPRDPFTTHRFLEALESSLRSVGTGTGWQPRYLVVRAGGQVIAVAPLYVKEATARASMSSTTTGPMPMSRRADDITPSCRWRCRSPRPRAGGF